MTKTAKTALITAVTVVSLALIAAGIASAVYFSDLIGRTRNYYSTLHLYEMHWDIKFPEGTHDLYTVATPPSFHGDGDSYTAADVSAVEGDITKLLLADRDVDEIHKEDAFKSEKPSEEEMAEIKSILISAGDDGRFTDDDLGGDFLWCRLGAADNSVLYLIYVPSDEYLHIIERLI